MLDLLSVHSAKFATSGVAAVFCALAWPETLPDSDRAALAARFSFEELVIDNIDNAAIWRQVRPVHPALRPFESWISSVGAAVALGDVDGDGLPNDLCLVDPRDDSARILPAPASGDRYRAISLDPAGGGSPAIAPMGCLLHDFDEDGRMDALVYYWGRPPMFFLDAQGAATGTGTLRRHDLFDPSERWFTNAATLADVDGDGHHDLIVGNYFADGDRILDTGATAGGTMQHSMSRAFNGGRNRLFLWDGAAAGVPRYRDASAAFEGRTATGWTLALGAADLTGDLLPEIYVANDFGPDRLLLNLSEPGRVRFRPVTGRRGFWKPRSKVVGRDSFKGMGVDFADLNADAIPDIAVSNIAQRYSLLESHFLFVSQPGAETAWTDGRAPYTDVSSSAGTWMSAWGWDIRFADLDNDGGPEILQATGFVKGAVNRWPELQELAMGNDELLPVPAVWPRISEGDDLSGHVSDVLFAAGKSGRYWDIWGDLGLTPGTVTRGIAVGDVYGDGRLAVALARQWEPSALMRNRSEGGQALVLDLRQPGALGGTLPAIGATVRVHLPDGRQRTGRVDGGSGHSGKSAPEVHIGLGADAQDAVVQVDIAWRDGRGKHSRTIWLAPGRHRIVLDAARAVLDPARTN